MDVDIYGHVTSRHAGSLKQRRSSVGVIHPGARASYKREAERRFVFKSHKTFIYALMMSTTSTYQLMRFVSRVREYQGVAFLIPFTFAYVCVGLPVLLSQLFVGQYAKVGVINAWRLSPLGTGVGYTMLALSVIKAIWFGRTIALHTIHIPLAMKWNIPWVDCSNFPGAVCVNDASNNVTQALAKSECCAVELNAFGNCNQEMRNPILFPSLLWHNGKDFLGSRYTMGDPIKEVYYKYAGIMIVAWCIMFILLQKELRFYSKMLVPIANSIVVITALLFVTVVFDGGKWSLDGMKFFFNMKVDSFGDNKLWRICFVQGLESLHVAHGTHILYGSYAPKNTNPVTTTVVIGFTNYVILMLVTFLNAAIGSVVAYKLGAPSPRCIQTFDWSVLYAAPGQYFGTLNQAAIWNILYFATLSVLDLVYTLLLLFSILQSLKEAWPRLKKYQVYVTLGLCSFCCLCGLPLATNAGFLLNYILVIKILPFISVVVLSIYTLLLFWVYGVTRLSDDIQFLTGRQLSQFWTLMWYLIPIPLVVYQLPVLVHKLYEEEKRFTYYTVVSATVLLVAPIIVLACYQCMVYFRAKKFYRVVFPAPEWGPPDPDVRHRRLHFNPRKAVRYSVDAPLKWRPAGLISKKQLKLEQDRLESHRKIFLEYVKMKREEAAAEAARSTHPPSGGEAGAAGKKSL